MQPETGWLFFEEVEEVEEVERVLSGTAICCKMWVKISAFKPGVSR